MKKRRYIILGVIVLLCLCLILLVRCNRGTQEPPAGQLKADEGADAWNGPQSSVQLSPGSIAIPGFGALTFTADQTEQQVNFYNPKENNCWFLMTLYIEGREYWRSGYVEAGKGYYSINLTEGIPAGTYDAELHIRCFRPSGEALNSARVSFRLSVMEA